MTENDWVERVKMGDQSAYEPLLAPYQPLLRSLARRFFCPSGLIARDELIQAGYLGLMRAAKRFDCTLNVRFITYALPWALGEMKRTLRSAVDSTGVYEKRRLLVQREAALCASLGRVPKLGELAQACGFDEMELAHVLESSDVISMDQCSGEECSPLLERLCAQEDIGLERIDLRLALDKIPEDERRVVMLRFFRGKTQSETAKLLGKSQAQVSKVESRALDRLRAMLM